MEDAVTCGVCSEVFQKGARDPLVLPCGHTFCRSCVLHFRRNGNFLCPTCRKPHNNIDCQVCKEHGDDLKYWCRDCEGQLCSLCLYSDHPPRHKVLLMKAYVQEKKDSLQGQLKLIKNVIGKTNSEIKDNFCDLTSRMYSLCKRSTTLNNLEKDVAALSSDIQKASGVESVWICETEVKSFMDDKGPLSLCRQDTKKNGEEGDSLSSEDAAAAKCERSEAVGQQEQLPHSGQGVGSHRSRLDCRDGRILLHCLHTNVDNHLFLKLPSEVFLELSANGHCFGRVYIHLMLNLRRAQQFMLLCLGTLGPSYIGSSFSVVGRNNNNEKTSIFCREYCLQDRTTKGQADLMNQLEWGGAHVSVSQEGRVSAHENNRHGFGIWVKSYGSTNCSFGNVTSGMEVVKAAVNHDPVTEVTITDCGLVIPDLMG